LRGLVRKNGKVLTSVAVGDDLYIYFARLPKGVRPQSDHGRGPNSWAMVYNLENTLANKAKVLGKGFLSSHPTKFVKGAWEVVASVYRKLTMPVPAEDF